MSRRSKPERRIPSADPIYNSVDVSKFINRVMRRGKKSIAEKYSTLQLQKLKKEQTKRAWKFSKKLLLTQLHYWKLKQDVLVVLLIKYLSM